MLAVSIVALVVAALSTITAVVAVRHAGRSANAAEASLGEAKRSADAAERAAGAAMITAEADRASDHRAREPQLMVTVDEMVEHDATDAIFRVLNDGPIDLDSVVVHRPILGEVEGQVVHQVARTGGTDYANEAALGSLGVTEYQRFTLSLGVRDNLPEFRVRITCQAGDEHWTLSRVLENPRKPAPPPPAQVAFARGRIPGRGPGGLGGF